MSIIVFHINIHNDGYYYIYYDTLQAKVKINYIFSKFIQLEKCVQQGGVLSGYLFNCFIDDLIIEFWIWLFIF